MDYEVTAGSVIGQLHRLQSKPNQDTFASARTQRHIVGFVCDGCSSGQFNHVGSRLGSLFLKKRAAHLLSHNLRQTELPKILFKDLLGFLKGLVKPYNFSKPEELWFRDEHLLFTIFGFVIGPALTQVITCGDGVWYLNGQYNYIDQDNTPTYPAFAAIHDLASASANKVPSGFEIFEFETQYVDHLFIGTDAWKDRESLIEESLTYETSNSLQMALNRFGIINDLFNNHDDATTVIAKRSQDKE